MSGDGRIASQGPIQTTLTSDVRLLEEIQVEKAMIETDELEERVLRTEQSGTSDSECGKLIIDEEIQIGRVSWDACRSLLLKG
jgi:hypothetical protein